MHFQMALTSSKLVDRPDMTLRLNVMMVLTAVLEGTNINVMDYKACEQWQTAMALAIAEDMIVKYGDEIDGVFCHWDNGATGVIEAFKAAGLEGKYHRRRRR